MTDNADIGPAIVELKKLHGLLIDAIEERAKEVNGSGDLLNMKGLSVSRETVIAVLPGDRRREDGWYRQRQWEKQSDAMMNELDPTHRHQVVKYHEIFLAAEALNRTREEIVVLMMHQVAHQAAGLQSLQSYHSEWIKIWMLRLFGFNDSAFERDEVLGWHKVNIQDLEDEPKELVRSIAVQLDASAFDLFRLKLSKPTSKGKMYKWLCKCAGPVVRSGGILRATCDKCNHSFLLQTDGVPESFLKRVPDDLKEV